MNCPKCQAEIVAGAKFCPECGHQIGTAIGEVSLGGLRTVAGEVSLGQMPTQISAAKADGGSGQRLGERYELVAEIGRGGFAVVWRARDLKLGREVAVKRLQSAAVTGALGQQVLERFAREGQTIAALNHRNIVMVYDHDRDRDGAYVVMEYVGGGSLREYLKSKGGKLEVAEAVELVKGVARGLAYAHRKNLVHRDIKPANILLSKEGGELIPKIVDFGLARMGSESELSLSGMGMGTPWYMPPEQRRNAKGVNHTADLYALGKTLYELVTGEVPDTVELEKLPSWLRPIIQRCIKNNPEERYFSAEELLKDLESPGVLTAQSATAAHAGQCPACGEINSEAEKYCKKCGAGLNKPCPECGREQRLNIRYCGGCGTDVPAFEKAAAIVATMRRHAGELKHGRVLKDDEELRQLQLSAKGSKGTQLISEAASLKKAAQEAWQKQATELNAIKELHQQGKLEAALDRLEALKLQTGEWGAAEVQLEGEIKNAWAGQFQEQYDALIKDWQYEAALLKLEKMGWLTNQSEWLAAWSNTFGGHLAKLVTAGQHRQAHTQAAFMEKILKQSPLRELLQQAGWPQRLAEIKAAQARKQKQGLLLGAGALIVAVIIGIAIWWWGFHLPGQRRMERSQIEAARQAGIKAQQEEKARLAAIKAKQEEEARRAAIKAQQDEEASQAAKQEAARAVAAATKENPFVNSFGMKFVPVPGTKVLFCIWDVREEDYIGYAIEIKGDNHRMLDEKSPVVDVSWEDAKAFCKWLTEKERAENKINASQSYRLPTDAEWTAAVGNTKYPWGERWPPPSGAGNYAASLGVDNYEYTSPVGSFNANQYGLYDMGGLVWQWCEDEYSLRPGTRVLRGASWGNSSPGDLLSSCRVYNAPHYYSMYIGFRCVLVNDSPR